MDFDNTIETAGTGTIELQFGNTLSKILSYDLDNSYFNFNDNLNIEGDLTLTGTINGIDISKPISDKEFGDYTSFIYINGKLIISDGTGIMYALHVAGRRGWTE